MTAIKPDNRPDLKIVVLDLINRVQKEQGMMRIKDVEVPGFTEQEVQKVIFSYMRDGTLIEIDEGVVKCTIESCAGKLDWGKPIIPASKASKAKGPYYNTQENKGNPEYMSLAQSIREAIANGHHSVIYDNKTCWFDMWRGGISMRPMVEKKV
jgi:hypothetical protein